MDEWKPLLGGHSFPRTHRPAAGMAGSTLVLALRKACDAYQASGAFTVRKKTRVSEVLMVRRCRLTPG